MLPQKIDLNRSGDVKMFFRVRNAFRDCTVRVASGDKVLIERKRKAVAPGEMETLVLKSEILAAASAQITVSLEEKRI